MDARYKIQDTSPTQPAPRSFEASLEGRAALYLVSGWGDGRVHLVSSRMTGGQPSRDVMMIPATMINNAAPRIAMAISPAEYFVFFFGGAV